MLGRSRPAMRSCIWRVRCGTMPSIRSISISWPLEISSNSSHSYRAAWLAARRLHLCAMNCFWMWAWASLGWPIVAGSAANLALQYSHTPSTGKLFSRLTILNLRFVMPQASHR